MKKTFLLTLISLLFLHSKVEAQYSGGTGTAVDPYQISTKIDLKDLTQNTTDWGAYFIQTADIVLSPGDYLTGGLFYNAGEGFSPIGNTTTPFIGSYNGNNYIIKGLYINRPSQDFIGLFGYTFAHVMIEKIKLMDAKITGRNNVGGIVGRAFIGGAVREIRDCYVTGTMNGINYVGGISGLADANLNYNTTNVNINGVSYLGGICGNLDPFGDIDQCSTQGAVTGQGFTGGFIGINSGHISNSYSGCTVTSSAMTSVGGFSGVNTSTIENSYSTGNVTGGDFTAGFSGSAYNGTFIKCFSKGNVNGGANVGGFLGNTGFSATCTITTCYSSGSVAGSDYVGGFLGYIGNSTNVIITNSYAFGNVSGVSYVGGFSGFGGSMATGNVTNCYSKGLVNGSIDFGGFLGVDNSSVSFNNCFWDITTSGTTVSAVGTGLPTSLMQTQTTFTGATWDFVGETVNGTNDIWEMGCAGYPVFDGSIDPSADWNIVNVNSCGTYHYTSASGSYAWASSGTYFDALTNSSGCDSLVYINLTVENAFGEGATMSTSTPSICDMDSVSIELTNSIAGNYYYLINTGSGAVVDGPVFGNDSTINFNTGNIASTQNFTITGSRGTAISLPDEDDVMRIENPFYSYSNEITIEGWVNFDAGHHPWAGQGTPELDDIGANVWLWHGGTFFINDALDGWKTLAFPSTLPTGWVHVATVADASGLYIYYNGVPVVISSDGIASNITINPFSVIDLGQDPRFPIGTPGRNSNNSFDNFRVWNKALNGDEIAESMSDCRFFGLPNIVQQSEFIDGNGATVTATVGSNGEIINPGSNWIPGIDICSCDQNFSDTITITANSSSMVFDVHTACLQYTWIDGNTYYSSTSSPSVTLTNISGCDSVVVLNLTIDTVNVDVTAGSITLNANASGATYQWIDCDNSNLPISGATNQSYTATVNGNYAVIVNDGTCSDTSACYNITEVGITDISGFNSSISVYPSPNNGTFTLETNHKGTFILQNELGQILRTIEGNEGNQKVMITGLSQGVYMISDKLKGSVVRVVVTK